MPTSPADADLVASFLAGDEVAFEDIFRRYAPLTFAVAFRMLGDRTSADEVVGNVFAHAAHRLGGLRDPAKLRPWLLAVTASEVRHLVRSAMRERRRRERAAAMRGPTVVDAIDEEPAYASEVLELIRSSLAPDDQVLLGLLLAETPIAELAEILGLDAGAVNTRKSRLLDRMRTSIEAYWLARPRAERCPELEALLISRRPEGLSRTTCRAISRHSRDCPVCSEDRSRVEPLALLGLAPVPAFLVHPNWHLTAFRSRSTEGVDRWGKDGFPRHRALLRRPSRTHAAALSAAVLAVVAGTVLGVRVSSQPAASDHRSVVLRTDKAFSSSPLAPTRSGTNPAEAPGSSTMTTIASARSSSSTLAGEASSSASLPTATTALKTVATTHAPILTPTHRHSKKQHATTTTTTTSTTTTTVVIGLTLDSGPIDLGQTATSAEISFHANGGAVSWTATTSASWLTVQPAVGTAIPGAEAVMTVSMDRSTAPTGSFQPSVTISSSAGSLSVPVAVTELAPASITGLGASPNPVSCTASTVASATVNAPAGVRSATLDYTGPANTSGSLTMNPSGSAEVATIVPGSCGRQATIVWTVVIVDGDGKSTSAIGPPITVLSG